MTPDRLLEPSAPDSQQPPRDPDVALPSDQIDRLRRQLYLTSEEAAIYLGLPSVQAVYHRIRRGTIPSWCYGRLGRDYRFNRAALDQLQAPQVRAQQGITARHHVGQSVASASQARGNSVAGMRPSGKEVA